MSLFLIPFVIMDNCETFFYQMYCTGEHEHNSLSTLFLATPEGCLKALLHDPYGMPINHTS